MLILCALIYALIWIAVFIHEAGHLVAARLTGMKVFRFKVGIGPHLRLRIGGTEYCFGIIPLGGYVFMPGGKETFEILKETGEADTFFRNNPDFLEHVTDDEDWTWQGRFTRSAFIFAAGPLANLATAAVMWWGAAYCLPDGNATYGKVFEGATHAAGSQVKALVTGESAPKRDAADFSTLEIAAALLFGLSLLSGFSNLIPVTGSDGFGILTCAVLGFCTVVLSIRDPRDGSAIRKKMGEWGGFFYVALLSFFFFLVLFELLG